MTRRLFTLMTVGTLAMVTAVTFPAPAAVAPAASHAVQARTKAPKLWTDAALADWGLPIAGLGERPRYVSEAEYDAAPIDNVKTYPVYLPDHAPAGYLESLRRFGPKPMVLEVGKARTEAEWIALGRDVFDQLDVPGVRTSDPRVFAYLADAEKVKRDWRVSRDGIVVGLRWSIDATGSLKLAFSECSFCHSRLERDGSVIRGAQGNTTFGGEILEPLLAGFTLPNADGSMPSAGTAAYEAYGVPWDPDDIHQVFKTMSEDEVNEVDGPPLPGTFSRIGGGPYFITRIPDLIGVKNRRYLDATATHLNRGPEDIARYGIMVATAEVVGAGSYRYAAPERQKMRYRFSDDAMYALGKYVSSLRPPRNPNRFDAAAARGRRIFEREGCDSCHTPPFYTNNKLTLAKGFEAPAKTPPGVDIARLSVGTDPALALRTRKGTGYYKVPSLVGLWYRGLLEHSGSVASLEEWFDPGRRNPDHVPGGWKGPGVTHRAIPGHPYGLDLAPSEKKALIAFLRTL